MNEPHISCVIPTYNDRINLPRAVASALGQEGVDVEVILVDDLSDAATRELITSMAATDPRIRSFLLPANGGQGQARNIGAMLARSRFVTFLDQDDEHAPGWYRYALDQLGATPSVGAFAGRAEVIDIPARLGIDATDLRVRGLNEVFITNIVFRRSVFLASGGFPTQGLWRSRVAGEDGVFRRGLAHNWHGAQSTHPALVHRAKEGGATVYFLDRTKVVDGQVVIARPDEIEIDGTLNAAQEDFWRAATLSALEVRDCVAQPQERDTVEPGRSTGFFGDPSLLKLNLGCGANHLAGWQNHDQDVDLVKPLPWADAAARFILLEHVLEHLNSASAYQLLEECWRVLAPGGVVRICVPDVTLVAGNAEYAEFMTKHGWGNSGVRAIACSHGHQMLWTFDSLAMVLQSIGFNVVKAAPRTSAHPQLCNVEGHHKVVGERINDIETLVVEGSRP
jgi:predicted SAM-dependent methyltransferase